jgi:pimeloyl-ACP methyl ester carboxylesterase
VSLVLLAPIGLDAGSWQWTDLPGEGTITHEFPGFGSRPRAPSPPDIAALADEVAELYPGDLDVVGVSLGGMVGQHLAVRHPERVRSLVVACTGASADRDVMTGRAVAAESEGMAAVVPSTLERWFTREALALRPEHPGVDYARRTLLALDPGSFADGWRVIAGHDARDRLPEIRARVTCVAGSADAASPVERTKDVADRIPESRFVVLDGPHIVHLERPAEFSHVVREHLRWVEGG